MAPVSTPVVMPQLGESVTEGTVTRWLKQVGDRVEADEPLLEVSTDKVDTEIPSPVGGFLITIAANEDDIVEVVSVHRKQGGQPRLPGVQPGDKALRERRLARAGSTGDGDQAASAPGR